MSDGTDQARELTFGEKAVGYNFNPAVGDTHVAVNRIKTTAANFIDLCNDLRELTDNGEMKRMYSVAITEAQTAQMWAVKAVTWTN